jgi:hypothetical protein
MVLRVFAAVLAVVFGAGMAFAQSDLAQRNTPPAAPPPAASATDTTTTGAIKKPKATKPKPAEAKQAEPKKKSKAADKKEAEKRADPGERSATNGSASAASPEMKAGLRDAFAAIPPAERAALQSDLIWTGDYNGLIDGQFSDRLADAVMTYQKRQNQKPTGVLGASERAALSAAVRPRQERVGWQVIDDPVIGARVGLPAKIATVTTRGTTGTRWSSAQGQLQIETFRIDTGATIEGVFEQEKKRPRRRISYNVIRPDTFVVSGMQGLKKMYVRGFAKDGEVRGVTILYDQAMEGTIDPIVVAMSSAFVPFANYASANAPDGPRRKVEYGTGLVVSPSGHVVTARPLIEGCNVVAIPRLGHAERLAEDKDSGLVLLRVYGASGLSPIQLRSATPEGDAVTLVGIADPQTQAGGSAVTTAQAKLNAGSLDPAPAAGFSGAAALDSQARLVGIVVQKSSVVAGALGAAPAALVPLARIRSFLDANYVPPAAGKPGLDGAKDAAVRIICVRK